MGNRKKAPPPGRKSSLKPPPDAAGGGGGGIVDAPSAVEAVDRIECVREFESPAFGKIKVECERALNALKRGNHNKALRLLKDSSHKYKNSALIHRVQATACVKAASVVDDPNVKQRHFKNALESARRAVELSPDSIEFAFYHANLLCELSTEPTEFEQVLRECDNALGIQNPIDPAKESLLDETQQKISTAEGRIANVQDELRALVQRTNIKSLSTWVKTFGQFEDKISIVPSNTTVEDPMEAMLFETRKPNEIKKANKTTEERRKEVEVRVAAARLLQQKPDSPPSLIEDDGQKTRPHFSSENANRSGEVRKSKNSRKHISLLERIERVRSYWSSMSTDMKFDLFRVRVCDMKAYFGSLKDKSAYEVLCEALAFAEANGTWKFWMCCRCSEKFADSDEHIQHVVREHMGSLLPRLQSIMPSFVENEWVEMIMNCSWKPLDISQAVDIIKGKPKAHFIKLADTEYGSTPHEECFRGSLDSPREDLCNGNSFNIAPLGNQLSIKDDFDECQSNQEVNLVDSWPLCDDPERAKLLDKIHALFQLLIRHRYLSSSHLIKVMQFTVDELQGLASGSELLKCGVDQSPTCICFLSAPKLRKILTFLQDVSKSCGLGSCPEKRINPPEASISGHDNLDNFEKIILSNDMSFMMLDELIFSTSSTDQARENGIIVEKTTPYPSTVTSKSGYLAECDALLSWIYSVPQIMEQLASWIRAKEQKVHKALDILQILEKEFCHLQGLCERKCDHLGYEEALQLVEDLCLQDGKKKESALDSASKGYESLLKKKKDELLRQEHDEIFIGNRFELDAISSVLREAESLRVNQMGYDGNYCDVTLYLRDLEYFEEENCRSNGYFRQMDTCIEIIIQRQKEQVSIELSKIDAKIMRIISEIHHIEVKLEPVAAYDFRTILLPLVKSFLQALLEDLAEKDATKKSDANREALLAELALDSQKRLLEGKGTTQDKVKEKKKGKDFRSTKLTKTKLGDDHQMVDNLTSEQSSYVSSTMADVDLACPHTSILVATVNHLEELSGNGSELEAEERKLQETLDYQRKVEYEAKQKRLAKQFKTTTKSFSGQLEVAFDTFSSHSDPDLNTHIKHMEQECGSQRNGFQDNNSGLPVPSSLSTSHKDTNVRSYHSADITGSDLKMGNKIDKYTRSKCADGSNQIVSLEKAKFEIYKTEEGMKHGDCHEILTTNGIYKNEGDGARTMQLILAEDDNDDIFQADLQKAVLESLDTFETHQEFPFDPLMLPRTSMLPHTIGASPKDATLDTVNGNGTMGTGLKNEVGEYNCFLNVIIQSLWHITQFRKELFGRSISEHVHVGDPCVVCALHGIFTDLSLAYTDPRREAVAPTSLRLALSNVYPDSNFFQEAQMNDASEVLGVIFECLHRSSTPKDEVPDAKLVKNNSLGSWDCSNNYCTAHFLFGMDIFERMNCHNCHLESRHLKYTSFFHNVNASSLRKMKAVSPDSSFDMLLNLVEMQHQLACDPEAGGCGMLNYINHMLSSPPHVFITVLGWQKARESSEDIMATLAALNTEINISVLYRGVDPNNKYRLVSVVCYYGQHYHCFAYSPDHGQWLLYDDRTVEVIGVWDEVLKMCERGHLQPQLLFFESIN
uniref:USP domain-containing protein n=1 Tax=Kalanchoe fedtschenkoi TaxID=63787 RepID=A0A7N0TYL4_KALFE